MEQELISIVVPVYRAERYIEETMDCVRAQTYPHWELLLVEDCGPDRGREIIEQYIQRTGDTRIRLLTHSTNLGAARARNLGVTEAGDGEDGRIKSALGIGALLCDGLGDTIRVSLSEAPEAEIPVARKLVDYVLQRENHPYIPGAEAAEFNYTNPNRRHTTAVENIGGEHVPVVISARLDGNMQINEQFLSGLHLLRTAAS